MNEQEQLSLNRSIKWVEYHMPSKTSEELWYLCSNILTELSGRDSVKYKVQATEESVAQKLNTLNNNGKNV